MSVLYIFVKDFIKFCFSFSGRKCFVGRIQVEKKHTRKYRLTVQLVLQSLLDKKKVHNSLLNAIRTIVAAPFHACLGLAILKNYFWERKLSTRAL
jgi:hypothetical protein